MRDLVQQRADDRAAAAPLRRMSVRSATDGDSRRTTVCVPGAATVSTAQSEPGLDFEIEREGFVHEDRLQGGAELSQEGALGRRRRS